jgi:hypothetical protein
MSKLDADDRTRILDQDIKEVWFCGYHSDVGSGRIPLRWVLAEAVAVTPTLRLSEAGAALLDDDDPHPNVGGDSTGAWWRLAEWIPRLEILNDRKYARRVLRWPSRGDRDPAGKTRKGRVHIHECSRRCAPFPQLEVWSTPSTRH